MLTDTDIVYQVLYQAFPNHHKRNYAEHAIRNFNHEENYKKVLENIALKNQRGKEVERFVPGFGAPKVD